VQRLADMICSLRHRQQRPNCCLMEFSLGRLKVGRSRPSRSSLTLAESG